ncbi:MAG: hypothetical protein NUV80_02370 [Candidatus Berkelbacteria bacterium]|nr:hypothetical protein [Candidatus Berkelbacteria bacterium]MCR4307378.1 hypothetical protein [Candidatus Berkelbacteria bacterium]
MKARNVTILWDGGWNDLQIDLDSTRPLKVEELQRSGDPFIGDHAWVRSSFLKGELHNDTHCVRILKRLDHGD